METEATWKVWTKRILLGLLGLLLALILLGGGLLLWDRFTGPQTADFTNTTYSDAQGNELIGYLARPEDPGPHPGIVLIHEWWGLNEGMTVLADALAEEGYIVFAPDAYRGRLASSIPYALWLRLTTPNDQVEGDMDSALAYLQGLDGVDLEQLASMGFCFGGGHSLQLGLRQSENLALTILYYGAVVTEPSLLRPLTDGQPVLGIFAEEDNTIFPEEVLEFEAALNSLEIPNQITIYPGVGHAFVTEENFDEPGPAGDAWQETLTFLDTYFE